VLASGKVVWGDPYTEGSQTAKSGTDEQERHMRLFVEGKQTHHCNAYKQQFTNSRCRGNWRKDNALTRGGLSNHELEWEKSADAIVTNGNELCKENIEVSQVSEGLNHKTSPISTGGPFHSNVDASHRERQQGIRIKKNGDD